MQLPFLSVKNVILSPNLILRPKSCLLCYITIVLKAVWKLGAYNPIMYNWILLKDIISRDKVLKNRVDGVVFKKSNAIIYFTRRYSHRRIIFLPKIARAQFSTLLFQVR